MRSFILRQARLFSASFRNPLRRHFPRKRSASEGTFGQVSRKPLLPPTRPSTRRLMDQRGLDPS